MFISLYFIVNSTWNQKQCPWNQTIFLPNWLSSCMLHLMTINCSTFSGFKEVLLGVTSQLWLHWGLQTSVDLPGQAWASRVGDIGPHSCNRSQSPIWSGVISNWDCIGLVTGQSTFSMEQLAAIICSFQVSSELLAFVQHWLIVILEALESIRNCQLLCVTAACVLCTEQIHNAAVQGFDHWYW